MDYGGWRPLNGRPGLRMALWSKAKVRGRELSLRPIGCTSALSVTQKRHCSCGMRLVALSKCHMLYVFAHVDGGTGRSGLVVARLPAAREGPDSNRAADKSLCFYAALGTVCILTAVPRSTQPSTLRGTANEYQPHG